MSFAKVAGKTGAIGSPSLAHMAQHNLIKKIEEIISFGDAPPHLVAPILKRITNASQLHALEISSPQILDLTPELWKSFIKRDIPDWEKKNVQPKDPSNWWKVYRKLKRDDDKIREAAEEKLRESLSAQAAHRKTNSALVLHAILPEERRSIGHLDRGVRSKDAGRNALNALKRQNAQQQMTRATINKMTPTNYRPQSQLSRPMSKIQGLVRQAPRSMLAQHSRQLGTPLPSRTSASRFTPSSGIGKPKQARNPFRTGAANMKDIHREALSIAVHLEQEAEAARQAEAAAKIKEIRARQAQSPPSSDKSAHPRFPDIMGKGTSRSGPEQVRPSESAVKERERSSPVGKIEGSPAAAGKVPTVQAGVKRKAGPSIFMAPKKRK